MYVGMQHIKIRQGMAHHSLLFGVWHRYRPLWIALEFTSFLRYPNTVSGLRAPDLIDMEQIVVTTFLAATCLGKRLRHSIVRGAWQVGESPDACDRILCRLRSLQTVITEWVLMGRDVRQCHWCLHFPNMGFHVKKLLQMQCLLF